MAVVQRGSALSVGQGATGNRVGIAVATSANGMVMAAGAGGYDGAFTNQGGVYIYDWSGNAWVQRGSVLLPDNAAADKHFGASVALSADGNVLAVGAQYGSISAKGSVYLFDWIGSAWVQRGGGITAADAAISDYFGSSVALSSDGSVLVVGAAAWEGVATNQGGVYIYDWSGSAWVQRGSVLTAADFDGYDWFGVSVALSSDASVLAVGSSEWDGPVSEQGGVYIYDWSGSAWVQRGSVLTAADATSGDAFGFGVALSSDAGVLAVGAIYWEAATTNQGGVYIYDWSGNAWVQRDSVVVSGAVAVNQYFGASVALSAAAEELIVGSGVAAYTFDVPVTGLAACPTRLSVTDTGTATAATALTIEQAIWVSSAPTELTMQAIGVSSAPTELTMQATTGLASASTHITMQATTGLASASTHITMQATTGAALANTALSVAYPFGAAAAATALTITAIGAATAASLLAVLGAGHAPNWSARCFIGGVDVSAQLVGEARVACDEGAARIASLTLQPPSGTVAPLDYVGKEISLDYVLLVAGVAVPRRLFTGRIDTPDYDPDTTLLRLVCVDDLQNRVAALARAVIDALVGGRYTEAVQGEILDNWDYAGALLSTVEASLDAGASGGMRVTPWQLDATWAAWGDGDLLYQRSRVTYPQRSTLINKVSIEFDYRYPRLRQRYTTLGWSGTYIDMAPSGFQYPTQQDIAGAAGGSGWAVTKQVFWPAPFKIPYGGGLKYVFPRDGAIDMAAMWLTQRHSQTVTEQYALTVKADESISANGELPHALRGALASEFDGGAWESALDVMPLMPDGGEQDHAPDAPRAAADYAIQTLLDQARVAIVGSHRSARLTNAVLCNPDLDLDKRVAISSAGMNAAGKVVSVTHTIDFSGGSAISEFAIACFGVGGAGILTPDTLVPPAPPAAATATEDWPGSLPSLSVATYGRTPYQEGLMGLLINPSETITIETAPGVDAESIPNPAYVAGSYPVTGFRVQMPGVDDADRNPLDKPVAQSYSILVPSDTLTFTVP